MHVWATRTGPWSAEMAVAAGPGASRRRSASQRRQERSARWWEAMAQLTLQSSAECWATQCAHGDGARCGSPLSSMTESPELISESVVRGGVEALRRRDLQIRAMGRNATLAQVTVEAQERAPSEHDAFNVVVTHEIACPCLRRNQYAPFGVSRSSICLVRRTKIGLTRSLISQVLR